MLVLCVFQVFTMLAQVTEHEDCTPDIRLTLEQVVVSEHMTCMCVRVVPLTIICPQTFVRM